MAGRRADTRWDAAIFEIAREHPKMGPVPVRKLLVARAEAKGEPEADVPSERTIARKQAWFREQSSDYQREFALVRWPETFESGDLPWEAAPLALRMLRRRWPERPPVRLVYWVWRLRQLAPDLPVTGTAGIAVALALALPQSPSALEVRRKAERLLLGVEPDGEEPDDLFFIAEEDIDGDAADVIERTFAPRNEREKAILDRLSQ